MVTEKRAFEGKSQLSVASAILEKEPDPITTLKPMTPPVSSPERALFGRSPLTTAGAIVGTIQYMSPEQVEGKEIDGRSDNPSVAISEDGSQIAYVGHLAIVTVGPPASGTFLIIPPE